MDIFLRAVTLIREEPKQEKICWGLTLHLMHKLQLWRAFKYIIVPVIICALVLICFHPGGHSCNGCRLLIVYSIREDSILHRLPLHTGESFSLNYIHSVTQTPVEGSFTVTAEGLILPLTTSFDTFGPGLPHLDQSTPYSLEDGRIVVQHREEARENIRIWVSELTQEHLIAGGSRIRLAPLDSSPLLLELSVLPRC